MMASPSELSLECKTQYSCSMLLKSVGGEQSDIQTQKLEDFLARLEEERLKIDAFKRELPLCMQLLTNAMEASRQQLHSYRANNNEGPKPILEEFIPLKHHNPAISEGSEKTNNNNTNVNVVSDKANWMTSAQLWSQASSGGTSAGGVDHEIIAKQQQQSPAAAVTSPKESDDHMGFGVNLKQSENNNNNNNQRNGNGNGGGGFLPFSKERNLNRGGAVVVPELALSSTDHHHNHHEIMEEKKIINSEGTSSDNMMMMMRRDQNLLGNNNNKSAAGESQTTTNQSHRKARRCWSPDLHRRFVNALQMLGGSQVATPKQIRELMKVDGLTNDEVKSHLQKYRLHTRRPSPSPQSAAAAAPQLVVLGGIWVPPEYATAAAAHHAGGPPTLYPTTHSSPHYCAAATPVPQEFYPSQAPTPTTHHHQLHHHHQFHNQIHVYQPPSQTQSSPESDVRGGTGDRSESIEDGKSESSSWKADSNGGENGGERKGLVVREDGEESNGSEITLKF
ncbi:hypothetical protein M9H77_01868 [Catharanthus roseus]|uniref:Uncharacterized protein n=1 Tax=Catharanthus roseus TaxID=4058 RepID=A0ACC0C6S8_CATRO|nr:hypothetical protein M9H77_01868 [Catharanthus roseus]